MVELPKGQGHTKAWGQTQKAQVCWHFLVSKTIPVAPFLVIVKNNMLQDSKNHMGLILARSKVFFSGFVLFGFHNVCVKKCQLIFIINAESVSRV